MLYQAYQVQSDLMTPFRLMAQWASAALWFKGTEGHAVRRLAAASEVLSRLRLTHSRPPYDIGEVTSDGQSWTVTESVVQATPFGSLVRFKKEGALAQPPVLLVAPLSGHFATLLRETARTLLQDHEGLCCTSRKADEITPAPDAAMPWHPRAPCSGARVA